MHSVNAYVCAINVEIRFDELLREVNVTILPLTGAHDPAPPSTSLSSTVRMSFERQGRRIMLRGSSDLPCSNTDRSEC